MPRRLRGRRRGVEVRVRGASGRQLREGIAGAARVRPVAPGETPFARVAASPTGGLLVLDELGAPMRPAAADDEAGRIGVLALLDVMARGRDLVELASGTGPHALTHAVDISLASLTSNRWRELPRNSCRVGVGERLSLRLRNLSPQPLWFWLFDIGVSMRSTLITNAGADGTRLGPTGAIEDTRVIWARRERPSRGRTTSPWHPSPCRRSAWRRCWSWWRTGRRTCALSPPPVAAGTADRAGGRPWSWPWMPYEWGSGRCLRPSRRRSRTHCAIGRRP